VVYLDFNLLKQKGGKMKRIFSLLLVLCMAVSFVPMAIADGKMGDYKKDDMESKLCKKMHMTMKYGDELGLTEKQQEQIKSLKIKLKKEMIQYKAKIEKKRVTDMIRKAGNKQEC